MIVSGTLLAATFLSPLFFFSLFFLIVNFIAKKFFKAKEQSSKTLVYICKIALFIYFVSVASGVFADVVMMMR